MERQPFGRRDFRFAAEKVETGFTRSVRYLPKALISRPISAISLVPNWDETRLGNDRFITAVTLLQHPRAISSDL